MDNTVQILSSLASIAAVIIAYISYRAYRFLLPEAQLKLQKNEVMNQIAGIILEFHVQQEAIAATKVYKLPLDPYLFSSRSRNAKTLYKLLDKAIKLGLWKELTGSHEWSLELFTAFRQSLSSIVGLDPNTSETEDYLDQHVLMGIVRLADQCRRYEGLDLKNDIEKVFSTMLSGKARDEAWNYLES